MTKLRFPVLILIILIAVSLCACGHTTDDSSTPEGIGIFGFEINPSAQPSMGQTVPGVDTPPVQTSEQPPAFSAGPVIEGDTPTSIKPSDSPTEAPTSEPSQPTSRPTSYHGGNGGNGGGGNGGGNGGGSSTPSTSPSPSAPSPSVDPDTPPSPSTSPEDTPVSPRPSGSDEPVVSPSSSGSDEPVTSPSISPPAPASSATIDEAMAFVGKPLSQLIAAIGYPYSSEYEDVVEGDPDTDRVGTLYFNGYVVTTLRTADGETVTSVVPN